MKVLVATDGSEHSLKAVKRGLELAELEGAQVTVMAVAYHAMEDLDEMPLGIQERLLADAKEAIQKSKALFDAKGLAVETFLASDFVPANSIVRKAKEGGFDMVLLGSRGTGTLKDVIIGSTAAKVSAHACCSVGVIR